MLDIGLECCYLFIYTGNILFDDEGQFLKKYETGRLFNGSEWRTLISTGRSSKSVFRLATIKGIKVMILSTESKLTHIALVY